ncbi:MAG: hypothetical protein WCI27_08930 [Candidatus Omnitrophota bacterium]
MRVKHTRLMMMFITAAAAGIVFNSAARADIAEIKKYKEAFPETKLKCIDCHVDAMPKKDEGAHAWNDYGLAVIAQAKKDAVKEGEPTVETYSHVGKIEDFKK